jgi:hypothetical protein
MVSEVATGLLVAGLEKLTFEKIRNISEGMEQI